MIVYFKSVYKLNLQSTMHKKEKKTKIKAALIKKLKDAKRRAASNFNGLATSITLIQSTIFQCSQPGLWSVAVSISK